MKALMRIDITLLLITLTLIAFGLVIIYSAGAHVALRQGLASDYYLQRQFFWGLVGFVAFMFGYAVKLETLQKYRGWIMVAVTIMLALVFVPGVGRAVHGSHRWIDLWLFSFQPSEIMKLAMLIFLAGFIAEREKYLQNSLLVAREIGAWVIIPIALILGETDLGTAVMLMLIVGGMLVLGGISLTHLGGVTAAAGAMVLTMVFGFGHGMRRIEAYIDPWRDTGDTGYHIIRSYMAFASGNIWGVGIGNSHQKLGYLPEPHTDFIFSVWGEEMGLIGSLALIMLFLLLFLRVLRIARQSSSQFGMLLAYGIGFFIVVQALLNMMVVTGVIPTTGMPLPFISFGGSSLCTAMLGMGLLMNVNRRAVRGKE